jgi:ATP/maltotriose-dependent transcriptional regulator MalT
MNHIPSREQVFDGWELVKECGRHSISEQLACGAAVCAALAEPAREAARLQRLIGLLINDILTTLPEQFVLVLDDLHAITDPAIFTALDYLAEHQPDQLRLIVLTRTDPPLALARLRARQRLIELRLPELRFTLDEVDDLLNDRLQLALTADELRALATHTEGWVAALRLIAGRCRGSARCGGGYGSVCCHARVARRCLRSAPPARAAGRP